MITIFSIQAESSFKLRLFELFRIGYTLKILGRKFYSRKFTIIWQNFLPENFVHQNFFSFDRISYLKFLERYIMYYLNNEPTIENILTEFLFILAQLGPIKLLTRSEFNWTDDGYQKQILIIKLITLKVKLFTCTCYLR